MDGTIDIFDEDYKAELQFDLMLLLGRVKHSLIGLRISITDITMYIYLKPVYMILLKYLRNATIQVVYGVSILFFIDYRVHQMHGLG